MKDSELATDQSTWQTKRYPELVQAMGGEIAGRLAKVECFLHIDTDEVRAWWNRRRWLGDWYTLGNGTFLCKTVIEWGFISHVESKDPNLTLYSRRAAVRDEEAGLRRCAFCGLGSTPGC